MATNRNPWHIAFICYLVLVGKANAEKHQDIILREATSSGTVHVKPSTNYSIDISGYPKPDDADLIILHVLDSPVSHYYSVPIQEDKNIYTFSEENVKPTKGSPEFKGLKSGDEAFLIIGKEAYPGSLDFGILINSEKATWIKVDK